MLSLRLLGGASLQGEGDLPIGPAAQRHRLALLALLVEACPRALSRDKLIAFLWPERDTEHGRNLLNQSVHVLRRTLGGGGIVSVGDDVRLDPSVVQVDVLAFEEACAQRRLEKAVHLYAGPFLDGFFLPGAAGFEAWVEGERERLRRAYAGALEQLAEDATSRRDFIGAAEWWRRLAALEPQSSRVTLRLMEALESAGDRGAALVQARMHEVLLEREFDAEPDPDVTALAERLRAQPATRLQDPGGPTEVAVTGAAEAPSARPGSASHSPKAGRGSRVPERRVPTSWWVVPAALIAGLLLTVPTVWVMAKADRAPPEVSLDPGVVAVLPFRVGGADPAMGYLREGMVDLLAAVLSGDGGLRAVDPRSLLSAWRRAGGDAVQEPGPEEARRLAASLGAGRLLMGEVTGAPDGLALSVTLLDVATGGRVAHGTAAGPPDSLLVLVDRIAVQLEARRAGEAEDRLPVLTGTSIAAVRAYLAGTGALRRGAYGLAIVELERAVALDSMFPLAALARLDAHYWGSSDAPVARAAAHAWSLRERLSQRDRALLEGMLGPRPITPEGPRSWYTGEILESRRHAVLMAPDRPEAWVNLGDVLFHWGTFHGIEAVEERADAAFRRALELDSTFAAPLLHMVELAIASGDTAELRARRDRYLAVDSTGDHAEFVRWRTDLALGQSHGFASDPTRLEEVPLPALARILTAIRADAVALADGPLVADALAARAAGASAGLVSGGATWDPLMEFALDRGRPIEALPYVARFPIPALRHVLNALYWDGEPEAAARGALLLAEPAEGDRGDDVGGALGLTRLCVWEQWRVAQREGSTASRTVARLAATGDPGDRSCALILGALLAVDGNDPARATAAAEELEAHLQKSGVLWGYQQDHANLVLARAHEAGGDLEGALAALRRRGGRPWGRYLSTYLREEGRLAAELGDHHGAIRAYRHYLALRSAPEPRLQPGVAWIARELDRLEALASER